MNSNPIFLHATHSLKCILFFLALLFASLLICYPSQALSNATTSPADAENLFDRQQTDREVLVKCISSQQEILVTTLESQGWVLIQRVPDSGLLHLRIPEGMGLQEAVEFLETHPAVEYVEPNRRIRPLNRPNDPFFSRQWALHNTGQDVNGTTGTLDADVDALEAWEFRTGSVDVVVAVIDTGVDYHHPDLEANIWKNPGEIEGNGLDDDGNGFVDDVVGWDFVDENAYPMDAYGHGTQVAGTVAAVGNNALGITGLNWIAQVMVLRIMDAFGDGNTLDAVRAIAYANQMGADVITLSWQDDGFSQSLKDAIAASKAVVVCGAGNAGNDNDITPLYPASYDCPNILSVAASDPDDDLPGWSNYGVATVDVAAPAVNIFTAVAVRETLWLDDFDDGDISDWTTGGVGVAWAPTAADAFSGTHSLTDSPGGDYANNSDSWARSPALNLSSKSGARLQFYIHGKSETDKDFLYVQTSTDGVTWRDREIYFIFGTVDRLSGTWKSGGGWITFPFYVDLGDLDGEGTVFVRFLLTSDGAVTQDGWYIDDAEVSVISSAYDGTSEYGYQGGTSMAVPHVAGLAALIKADKPSLSNLDIKGVIEQTVDKLPAFNGKVVTGGRVNAARAMDDLYDPWTGSSTGCFLSVFHEERHDMLQDRGGHVFPGITELAWCVLLAGGFCAAVVHRHRV